MSARSPAPAVHRPISDRQVEVETPEHVAISYELADLGSRFAALLLDGLVIGGILFFLWVGIPLLVTSIGTLPAALASTGLALLVLASFVVFWGYFVYYEGFRDGQTPGKRRLSLRVVRDGGYPAGFSAAVVRNLLRVVDIQPPPSWILGGVVMLLHPKTKRLGDIAAGTVVVRERGGTELLEEHPAGEIEGSPRLTDEEFAILQHYIARRRSLPTEARLRIARKLYGRLHGRVADDPRSRASSHDAYLVLVHGEEARRRGGSRRGEGSSLAEDLVRRQRSEWISYRSLLDRAASSGLGNLTEDEVSRFAELYRETAADLARARSYGASQELLYSLERWVGAGHNVLYRPRVRSVWAATVELVRRFPRVVRRCRWAIALSALMLFGPALVTGASIHEVPARARQILPAEMIARAEEGRLRQARGERYVEIPEIGMPVMASTIIANNVQVSFLAFAGGILAGVGTAATLIFNGVFLGAVFGLFAAHGLGAYLLTFVLPHGVLELSAICMAGGAGLWLGSAILIPGRRTRGEALVARGKDAVTLICGVAVLLLIAGLIEGFISPAPLPFEIKAGVALLSALLLGLYLMTGAATPRAPDQSSRRAFTSR